MSEIRRDVVKLGIDFRPIPVDLGDGIEWEFHPDPSPEQWTALVAAIREFGKFGEDNFGGPEFQASLEKFTEAMAEVLTNEEQKKLWREKRYGLGAQQAISQALMEMWTGFPTKSPSPSGKASGQPG